MTKKNLKKYRSYSEKMYEFDRMVSSHEAGHFIFFLRALVQTHGLKTAKKMTFQPGDMIITLERLKSRKWAEENGDEKWWRDAFFRADKMIFTDPEYNILHFLGGLAVDLSTKNKNLMGWLNYSMKEYEKYLYNQDYEVAEDVDVKRNDVVKAMKALIREGGFNSYKDLFKILKRLNKSITNKEWALIHEIVDEIERRQRAGEDYVVLDLAQYVRF